MLKKFKDAREAAHAERARDEAEQHLAELVADATRAYEAWEHAKLDAGVVHVDGVQLKKNEVVYLVLNGVGLVEPRRGPTQWVGGSQGVSFKLIKGVRYRVGGTRGHVVQGEERPVVIDTGTGVVTNQRMVFIGDKRSTEWAYAKLLGFSLEQDGAAVFNVSNRQKASGFAYQPEVDHIVDAVVSAATAAFQGSEEHQAVVESFLKAYTDAYAEWQSVNAEFNAGSSPAFGPPAAD
ncbi:MAG TPA: hypothetical protein VHN36_19745 [Ilumatobacteraceae bacterium]|nr:hypothetical protein [Ilumatobacteraceae bacterium]